MKKQKQREEKPRGSTTDLAATSGDNLFVDNDNDDIGSFDRYSSLRRTVGRGSVRSSSGSSRYEKNHVENPQKEFMLMLNLLMVIKWF